MSSRPSARPLCAELSRADAEPLAATASRVETWLLLEYRGLWAHDAVDGSTLGEPVKRHLRHLRGLHPHLRILFVRRTERRGNEGLLGYLARTTQDSGELRRFELERYEDVLDLDLASAGEPVSQPLFLVCTHGKHDRCCSKFGRPLYDAVREQLDDGWVWQSSHVGGDRFAGNLVHLPDGVYYGRVDPHDAWPVLEAALAGRVHLPAYRGRSCHPFPAQAAERAVRELTGRLGVREVRVESVERVQDGWRAAASAGGAVYDVDVRLQEGELTYLTCATGALRRPRHFVAGTPRARAS